MAWSTQKGPTLAQLSSIEIKLKHFLEYGAIERQPSRIHGRAREVLKFVLSRSQRDRRRAGLASRRCRDPPAAQESPLASPSANHRRSIQTWSPTRLSPVEAAIEPAFGRHPGCVSRPWLRTICGHSAAPRIAISALDDTGFAIEPLRRGFIFLTQMEVDLVAEGEAHRVVPNTAFVELANFTVGETWATRFSHFRVLAQGHDGFPTSRRFPTRLLARGARPTLGTWTRPCRSRPPIRAAEDFHIRTVSIERRRSPPARWPSAR